MNQKFSIFVSSSLKKFNYEYLLTLLIFFIYVRQVSAQNEPVMDGTEGETFRNKDSAEVSNSKFKHWNEFDGPLTTLKFGGGFLYEYNTFSQDEKSKEQVTLDPGFKVRDFRVTMAGQFKFDREITWKVGIMRDGATDSWLIRETGVTIKLPELSGHIFIGRTKEGYSLSKVMNGYSIWHFERNMSIDVIPILADGIKYLAYFPKTKIGWNIGIFDDFLSKNQSFSTYQRQFVSRIYWLPVYQNASAPVLHVGLNYRYGKVKNGELQVRSRPESNLAPYFVDTKIFPVTSSNHIGGELYFRSGAFLFGSEFNAHMMNSTEKNNPVFTGGEAFVAYIFTGEIKPYLTQSGIFTFIKVKNPVFKGGMGAWEIVMRYSSLDLDDQLITGGTFWRFTPQLNWYLNDNIKFSLDYGYGKLDRYGTTGSTQFFQSRILFML